MKKLQLFFAVITTLQSCIIVSLTPRSRVSLTWSQFNYARMDSGTPIKSARRMRRDLVGEYGAMKI